MPASQRKPKAKQQVWQENLLARLDERRSAHGEVVQDFDKYLRNFESWCSDEEDGE